MNTAQNEAPAAGNSEGQIKQLPSTIYTHCLRGVNPNDCWTWTGAKSRRGYAMCGGGNRREYVHRIAYRLLHGSLFPNMHVHHLCGNLSCINPLHLRALTPREHVHAHYVPPTNCPHGHPYTVEDRDARGKLNCRACVELRYLQKSQRANAHDITQSARKQRRLDGYRRFLRSVVSEEHS